MTACNACGSSSFKKLFTKDMLTNKYNFVVCKKCSLKFLDPLPKQLDEYYNGPYVVPSYQEKKVKRKAQKIFSYLKRQDVKKGNLLDIGASHGFFLNIAKQNGFTPHGIELDKRACAIAKKRFNIKIENKLLEESSFAKKKNYFDVIVMLDVLEHVPDPNLIIKTAYALLKKDGLFILTMPNGNATEMKLFKKYWEWSSPPAHIYYFTPKSIKKIFTKNKFTLRFLQTYRGDTAGNLLFHAYLALRQKIFYSLRYVLGKQRLIAMRSKVCDNIDAQSLKNQEEFTGISKFIKYLSEVFYKISFDKKRFKKLKGPSLFVVARK